MSEKQENDRVFSSREATDIYIKRFEQFERIYNTSVLDEIVQENREMFEFSIRPIIESVYNLFNERWQEKVEAYVLSQPVYCFNPEEVKDDFLKLSKDEAKEKLRSLFSDFLQEIRNENCTRKLTISF